jgi:hypothetical protein
MPIPRKAFLVEQLKSPDHPHLQHWTILSRHLGVHLDHVPQ